MKNAIPSFVICLIFLILLIFPSNSIAHNKSSEELRRNLRESVVLITTFINITLTEKNLTDKYVHVLEDSAYGTGVIVEHKEDVSFIITAAHVCDIVFEDQIKRLFPTFNSSTHEIRTRAISAITDIEGKSQPAFIYGMSIHLDVCILITEKMKYRAMKISKTAPRHAEKVYSMGFPAKTHEKGIVLLFEGFYAGRDMSMQIPRDIFTIPTTSGSSGSPIFTENGEIVAIVTIGNIMFENWNACVTYDQLSFFYNYFTKLFSLNGKQHVEVFKKEMEKIRSIEKEKSATPEIPDAVLPSVPETK